MMWDFRHVRLACWLVATALILSLAASAASAQEVCEGFKKYQRIGTLGGPNAFSKEKPDSPEELQALIDKHWAELEGLFAERGIADLAPAFRDAVRQGSMSQRDLVRGEEFHWMAWRKGGVPKTTGPVCFAAVKKYSAWEIRAQVVKETEEATYTTPHTFIVPRVCLNIAYAGAGEVMVEEKPALCEISAKRSCDADSPMLTVDATGSSPGARVLMMVGDGPAEVVIPAGSAAMTWQGADADPYRSTVTFKVVGPGDRCDSSVALEPCEAPDPYCEIQTEPQVRTGEEFTVAVSGHKEINLQVADAAGNVMPFSESMSLKRPGTYSISGTAANEVGETATCSASVEVLPRWTFRPFLAKIYPDDARAHESIIRPNGVNERSDFNLDNDFGIGADLEYHFGPKIGLAAGLLYSEIEAHFMYDLDDLWGMDEDDVSFFMFTLGPNFHLTPNKRLDFYIQPFIGWVDLGDATFNTLGETVTRKVGADDFALGLGLGLDIPFGPATPWALNLGARYVDLSADIRGNFEKQVSIDPMIFSAGLSYSF